jgi:peptidoglycan/xylan/chitin deacetylase (PgdA/CDA1 family)
MKGINISIGIGIGRKRKSSYWTKLYTDAEISALISDDYIPIASPSDLNAIRTTYSGATKREFASGTAWATGQINTTGLAGKYIQVANINLDNDLMILNYGTDKTAPDNFYSLTDGWLPLGIFTGIFDGGGKAIQNLFINRPLTDYVGLFTRIRGTVKNLFVNGNVTSAARASILSGLVDTNTALIDSVVVSGILDSVSNYRMGGIVAEWSGGLGTAKISNCVSFVLISQSSSIGGGIIGYGTGTQVIENCYAVGFKKSGANVSAIGGYLGTVVASKCYYDKDSTLQSKGLKAISDASDIVEGKTTSELMSLTQAVTGWLKFDFGKNRYPMLKAIGEIAANRLPPSKMVAEIINNVWSLTWVKPVITPRGYFIYQSYNSGVWTKITSKITTTSLTIETPVETGTYDYCVTAEYLTANGIISETLHSNISRMQERFDNGKLVITFDDSTLSQYTNGFALLESEGVKGTFYITTDYVGLGQKMTWAQIQAMMAAGHSIQDHSKDHHNFSTLDEIGVNAQIDGVDSAFLSNSITVAKHLAYPFGEGATPDVINWIGERRITGRGAGSGGNTYPGTTKMSLPSRNIDNIGDSGVTTLEAILDSVKLEKTAQILHAHGVTEIDEEYSISIAHLTAIITKAKSIGLDIITISELEALMP